MKRREFIQKSLLGSLAPAALPKRAMSSTEPQPERPEPPLRRISPPPPSARRPTARWSARRMRMGWWGSNRPWGS